MLTLLIKTNSFSPFLHIKSTALKIVELAKHKTRTIFLFYYRILSTHIPFFNRVISGDKFHLFSSNSKTIEIFNTYNNVIIIIKSLVSIDNIHTSLFMHIIYVYIYNFVCFLHLLVLYIYCIIIYFQDESTTAKSGFGYDQYSALSFLSQSFFT